MGHALSGCWRSRAGIEGPLREADEEPGLRWACSAFEGPGRLLLALGDNPAAVSAVLDQVSQNWFVLVSVDDLEGLEITLEVLSDEGAVGRIAESLASLESGDPGATVAQLRTDLARRRAGA